MYFLLHNTISVLFFFILMNQKNLLSIESTTNLFLTLECFLMVSFISFTAGILGRGLSMVILYVILEGISKKVVRRTLNNSFYRGCFLIILGCLGMITILFNLDYKYLIFSSVIIFFLIISGLRIDSASFVVSVFMSSILWILGALYVIQESFFQQTTIATLLISYLILKIVTYILSKVIVQTFF